MHRESSQPDHVRGDRHEDRVQGREEIQGQYRRRIPNGLRLHLRSCQEYPQVPWMIHTKSGAWIVNVETMRKIPFRRVGNTYFRDVWLQVP